MGLGVCLKFGATTDGVAADIGSPEPGVWALRRPIGTLGASRVPERLRENEACTGHTGLRWQDHALRDRAVS